MPRAWRTMKHPDSGCLMSRATSLLESTAFLREAHVLVLLQVSRATLARWVKQKRFPAPVQLSHRIKAWKTDDVREWIARHQYVGEGVSS